MNSGDLASIYHLTLHYTRNGFTFVKKKVIRSAQNHTTIPAVRILRKSVIDCRENQLSGRIVGLMGEFQRRRFWIKSEFELEKEPAIL
jgi:hypothetical protein